MSKIKIKTTYPCVIKTKDDFFDLDTNDLLEVDDENFLFVYPLEDSKRMIPFCIDTQNMKNGVRYSYYDFENFYLVVLNDKETINSFNKSVLNFSGTTVEVFVYADKLKFQTENFGVEDIFVDRYENFKIFKIDIFACVMFDSDRLYCFDSIKNKLAVFKGEKIDTTDTNVVLKKIYAGFDKHTKIAKYNLTGGKVILSDSQQDFKSSIKDESLCAVRFLEAVRASSYDYAKTFLSEKLKEKVQKEQLEEFFGQIRDILPISEREFVLVCSKDKKFVKIENKLGIIEDILIDVL